MVVSQLARETNGKNLVGSVNIAREFELTTKEDSSELIDIYEQYEEECYVNIIKETEKRIKIYKGLVKRFKEEGAYSPVAESSVAKWEKDVSQLKKAVQILNG